MKDGQVKGVKSMKKVIRKMFALRVSLIDKNRRAAGLEREIGRSMKKIPWRSAPVVLDYISGKRSVTKEVAKRTVLQDIFINKTKEFSSYRRRVAKNIEKKQKEIHVLLPTVEKIWKTKFNVQEARKETIQDLIDESGLEDLPDYMKKL